MTKAQNISIIITHFCSICLHFLQINRMKSNGHKITDMNGISKHEVNDRISEINSLRTELERVRKDKNITSGLVTQMQRDMTSKVRK